MIFLDWIELGYRKETDIFRKQIGPSKFGVAIWKSHFQIPDLLIFEDFIMSFGSVHYIEFFVSFLSCGVLKMFLTFLAFDIILGEGSCLFPVSRDWSFFVRYLVFWEKMYGIIVFHLLTVTGNCLIIYFNIKKLIFWYELLWKIGISSIINKSLEWKSWK